MSANKWTVSPAAKRQYKAQRRPMRGGKITATFGETYTSKKYAMAKASDICKEMEMLTISNMIGEVVMAIEESRTTEARMLCTQIKQYIAKNRDVVAFEGER